MIAGKICEKMRRICEDCCKQTKGFYKESHHGIINYTSKSLMLNKERRFCLSCSLHDLKVLVIIANAFSDCPVKWYRRLIIPISSTSWDSSRFSSRTSERKVDAVLLSLIDYSHEWAFTLKCVG